MGWLRERVADHKRVRALRRCELGAHRDVRYSIQRSSIGTGVPISTAYGWRCEVCGKDSARREITGAGYQQLSWGAAREWVEGRSEDPGVTRPQPSTVSLGGCRSTMGTAFWPMASDERGLFGGSE